MLLIIGLMILFFSVVTGVGVWVMSEENKARRFLTKMYRVVRAPVTSDRTAWVTPEESRKDVAILAAYKRFCRLAENAAPQNLAKIRQYSIEDLSAAIAEYDMDLSRYQRNQVAQSSLLAYEDFLKDSSEG